MGYPEIIHLGISSVNHPATGGSFILGKPFNNPLIIIIHHDQQSWSTKWLYQPCIYIYIYIDYPNGNPIWLMEGSLEVKLPTIGTVGKAKVRRVREEKKRSEKIREAKKMQVREKVGESRFTGFSQRFVAQEGRKVGSLKRRVRSQLARWEMKNCTPLWREAHFQVKMHKTHSLRPLLEVEMSIKCTPLWREARVQVKSVKKWWLRTIFGRWDAEKVCAVLARSTFDKSKCTKHTILGPLLEVAMSKKCTPLWREAHFQVKMLKAARAWITFWLSDVEKVQVVVAWSRFPSQHVQNATCTDHFWPLRCGFAWQVQGIVHLVKSE